MRDMDNPIAIILFLSHINLASRPCVSSPVSFFVSFLFVRCVLSHPLSYSFHVLLAYSHLLIIPIASVPPISPLRPIPSPPLPYSPRHAFASPPLLPSSHIAHRPYPFQFNGKIELGKTARPPRIAK